MKVKIGTEAVQIPEKEYIYGTFVAVYRQLDLLLKQRRKTKREVRMMDIPGLKSREGE
jgi:hypothetical protein